MKIVKKETLSRLAVLSGLSLVFGLAIAVESARADALVFYDNAGSQTVLNTDTLNGCVTVYDSGRRPLQICRLVPVAQPAQPVIIVPQQQEPEVGLGSDRQQDRATARRVQRRHDKWFD